MKTNPLLIVSVVLMPTLASAAQDWPQWRGPTLNGVAPGANPPVEWSEAKNVKWKVKLPGEGSSTPIIWGDRIFVTAAINTGKKADGTAVAAAPERPGPGDGRPAEGRGGDRNQFGGKDGPRPGGGQGPGGFNRDEFMKRFDKNGDGQLDDSERAALRESFGGGEGKGRPGGGRNRGPGGGGFGGGAAPSEVHQFVVICLDRATGKEVWRKAVHDEVPHEGHHRDGSFAAPSPVTDGKHVYASFGSRGLYCLDLDGNVKWSNNALGKMRTSNGFGEGCSPALHGDVLVVKWDHEGEDYIAAFNKDTGKEMWRQPREERTSWSTPLVVVHEGKPQVVTTASGRTRSYDLTTGRLLWECSGLTSNVIPTPVSGHGMFYALSGYRGYSLQAIKLGRTGDLSGTDAIAWSHSRGTPYVPSPLLNGGKLYFFSSNNGVLTCLDAVSGRPHFAEERVQGLNGVYASPVAAGDKVYLTGRDGTVVVIKDSTKLEVVATNKLEEGIDASPAIVGGEILLRGKQHLYCIAAK